MNTSKRDLVAKNEAHTAENCGDHQYYNSRFWLSVTSMALSGASTFAVLIKFICCSNNVFKCSCLNRPYKRDPDYEAYMFDKFKKNYGQNKRPDWTQTRTRSMGNLSGETNPSFPLNPRPTGVYNPDERRSSLETQGLYPDLPDPNDPDYFSEARAEPRSLKKSGKCG